MKKLLLLLFVHLIFFSGESKKEGIDAIPEKEERNSILWKIEKDDQISYLFGTTHIMCEDQMKYKDILDALVKEVDVIVFESDDDDEGDPMPYGKGIFGIDIPESYKLKNFFSDADLLKLRSYYDDLNFNDGIVDIIMNTDIVSASLIEVVFIMMDMDCDITGSELYIESINKGKEELYLEFTPEINDVIKRWIYYTYENIDISTMNIQAMIDYSKESYSEEALLGDMINYNNNDPQADFDDMLSLADPSDPNFEIYKVFIDGMKEFLLYERNEMWMPRIINIMNDDKALFAVGSLHVLDLVERLEQKGYTLTPLDI